MQVHNASRLEGDEVLPSYIIASQIQFPHDVKTHDVKKAAHFPSLIRLSASHGTKNLFVGTYLMQWKYGSQTKP